MQLTDKIGVVTGGGSGMGRAAALAMAREGATVVLAGRTLEKLEVVRSEIESTGGRALAVPADVSKREEVKRLIGLVEKKFGRLDLAFNNAGGHADMKPIDQTTEEESEWVIDLNFKAVYYGVKYEAELMLKGGGGRIVNNASIFGLKAMPGIAHYTASKFAVIGLTRAVALEYASRNIRVNAVCPGATETPNFMKATGGDAHAFDNFIPMRRIGRPEEVAEAVVWLMSDKASYATGAVLSIDGGMYAG
jgi:NAD(P)-dependent dehydrogenase (short-subunit alcohol dehydrogenase family)